MRGSGITACRSNMRLFEHRRDVFAYSPFTGEESSATPGDYFMLMDDEPLRDGEDNVMILVTRSCSIQPLQPSEAVTSRG